MVVHRRVYYWFYFVWNDADCFVAHLCTNRIEDPNYNYTQVGPEKWGVCFEVHVVKEDKKEESIDEYADLWEDVCDDGFG